MGDTHGLPFKRTALTSKEEMQLLMALCDDNVTRKDRGKRCQHYFPSVFNWS
jgi:hypothetical protein